MENCYLIPNIRGVGYLCKTNIAPCTGFRGFGVPQSVLVAESWISEIAVTCGISQRQVREMNFYKEGDLTHYNQKLTRCHLQRVWNELVQKCDYEERRKRVDSFNGWATCEHGRLTYDRCFTKQKNAISTREWSAGLALIEICLHLGVDNVTTASFVK